MGSSLGIGRKIKTIATRCDWSVWMRESGARVDLPRVPEGVSAGTALDNVDAPCWRRAREGVYEADIAAGTAMASTIGALTIQICADCWFSTAYPYHLRAHN